MKNIVAAIVAAVATGTFGADFSVPQGGGKLPTIALVTCLADEGTQAEGQYCRATYDCSGDTGVLWEGLTFHNGRRVTLETDPISNLRDCVLKVEDPASVSFYTGYRPEGPNGKIVAMVRSGNSAASTTTGSPVRIPPANMLGQFLSHPSVRAATLADWCRGRGRDGDACEEVDFTSALYLEAVPATDKTACYIEAVTVRTRGQTPEWLGALHLAWLLQDFNPANDSNIARLGCNDL